MVRSSGPGPLPFSSHSILIESPALSVASAFGDVMWIPALASVVRAVSTASGARMRPMAAQRPRVVTGGMGEGGRVPMERGVASAGYTSVREGLRPSASVDTTKSWRALSALQA